MKKPTRSTRLFSFIALLFCLVPLLQACGDTSTNGKGPVTITVAYQQFGPPPYHEEEWWKSAKTKIEAANPNIKVKLMPIIADEGSYYTKLDLMLRSNNPPDVVREDSFLVGSDVTAGYLAPMDSYLDKWPDYKAQWFDSMQKITTFNSKNYGVMDGTDVRAIWFNKDIFKKAGLPTDWQPKSWAEILSAAHTIKNKVPGVIPMNLYSGVPMDEASTMQGFEMLLYGTKDTLYNYQNSKWVSSSKGFKDALNFVKEVYNPSALLGPTNDIALSTTAGNTVSQQLIPQGKLAIDIDGSWMGGTWEPNGSTPWPQWKDTMGLAKMPTQNGEDPKYVTLSGGWAYSIAARSPHKDQAFEVIKNAFAKDLLGKYDIQTNGIAPRKDIVSLPEYSALPNFPFFTQLVDFTQFRPGFPAYPKISVQIDSAMQQVMNGKSADDAMSAFSQSVESIAGSDKTEKHP
ncbi:sugar ABC transporter substrate-binding protein [Dictyobacter vulcani]|uniref:Sugar ABC transporter substrate-binding protein n=1 Tax=Dictyobacter vulcani TaxID=2607529 RepID=A0A5J4KZ25_9CHLR|nr:extracellular solute-binding protein [Dictyobacter vulcani]GER90436.1 sugar ABC transporter substrate-binding protein [Dictyobacter vulcani]